MKKIVGVLLCVLFAASATMWADTVISTSGQWNAPHTANNGGGAFWDNRSSDGANCNVGFVLQGVATGCSNLNQNNGPYPGTALSYLSSANGTPTSFSFTPGTVADNAVFRASYAGNNTVGTVDYDVFGWVDLTTNTLHPLFNTLASSPETAFFSPTGSFAYYLAVFNGNTNTLVSEWETDTLGGAPQFALFSQNPANPGSLPTVLSTYWIGAEDNPNGDHDYQDILVQITPVPEPATLAMFGSGLLGLAGVIRRRLM